MDSVSSARPEQEFDEPFKVTKITWRRGMVSFEDPRVEMKHGSIRLLDADQNTFSAAARLDLAPEFAVRQ